MERTCLGRRTSASGLFSIAHLPALGIMTTAFIAALVVALAVGVSPAIACPNDTWFGGSGNWSDPNHWTCYPYYPDNNGELIYDPIVDSAGVVTVDGSYTVSDFTLSGPGVLGGTGTITANGVFHWGSSNLFQSSPGGTVNAMGGVDFVGIGSRGGFGTLRSYGPTVLSGRFLSGDPNYFTFENMPGATFDITTPSLVTGTFNNYGTLRTTGATGVRYLAGPFHNSGLVEVQSGTLHVGAATSSGQFDIAAGATLSIDGPVAINQGTLFTGDGNLQLGSWDGTTQTVFNTDVSIHPSVAFTGIVEGTGTVTIETKLATDGWMAMEGTGKVILPHGTTFDLSGQLYLGRELENSGTVTQRCPPGEQGYQLMGGLYALGTFTNMPDGVYDLQSDLGMTGAYTGNLLTFNNQGLFKKALYGGVNDLRSIVFNNTGTVQIQAGGLLLGSGTSGGEFSGGSLAFGAGMHNLQPTAVIDGDGWVFIEGATVRLDGQDKAQYTALDNGRLEGIGSIMNSLGVHGGTLAPGNSAGVFTVGDLALTGGTLEIEVTGAGGAPGVDYDRLAVTRAASGLANGALLVKISPNLNLLGDVLTILTTASDLSGQGFGQVTFQGGIADVTYGDGSITLSRLAYVGDADRNGIVDVNDLDDVFNTLGLQGQGIAGDANGDGIVDVNDLNNVFNNLGNVMPTGGDAVPEPATLALLAAGGLLTLRRRRQRNGES